MIEWKVFFFIWIYIPTFYPYEVLSVQRFVLRHSVLAPTWLFSRVKMHSIAIYNFSYVLYGLTLYSISNTRVRVRARHEGDQSFLVPVRKKIWTRSRREKVLGLGLVPGPKKNILAPVPAGPEPGPLCPSLVRASYPYPYRERNIWCICVSTINSTLL